MPFYLIFFALAYTLTKFLPFEYLLPLLVLLIAIEGVFFAGFYYRFRDIRRAGFCTFLILVWALYFGTAAHILRPLLNFNLNLEYLLLFLLPWTLAFGLLGIGWLWRKRDFPNTVTTFLNVFTLVIVLFAGYRLLFGLSYEFFEPAAESVNEHNIVQNADNHPDIYYIILDGYGRQDMLQKYLEFDNSEFIDFLESRGFNVAAQSKANYLHTIMSISSSLNMGYINPTNQSVHLAAFKEKAISNNQVSNLLKNLGYQFVTFYNPYELTDITHSGLYFALYDPAKMRNMRMVALLSPGSLAAIPLEAELISPLGTYRDYQEYFLSSLDQLAQIPFIPGPKFVFFHVLIPHTPFIFDQDGPITPDRPYLLVRDFRGTQDERISGYIGQLSYLNIQVEKVIDEILENSSIPPVIILQGDHGPGIFSSSNNLEERASILNAYYLPGLAEDPIYEAISPVNSFRVIFNQYFGMNFAPLEDLVYNSKNGESFSFFDVTDISQQTSVIP